MVAQFPKPLQYNGGIAPPANTPMWTRFHVEAPKYKNEVYEYISGADFLSWADGKDLIFVLDYENKPEEKVAVLDAHYDSAQGELLGFSFYDHRTENLYVDCHYLKYERPAAEKRKRQTRRIEIIKRGHVD